MRELSPEERIRMLSNLCDIQRMEGNWNYDEYHFGLANGLILALATILNENPNYLDAPEVFLRDLEMIDKINKGAVLYSPNKED